MSVYLSPVLNGEVLLLPNGTPNYGGTIKVNYARTTLLANTYSDNTGLILCGNPIQIDTATARVPGQIWIPQGQATKFTVYDSKGQLAMPPMDDILGVNDPSYECIQANTAYNLANAAYLAANLANGYAQTALTDANTAKVLANSAANTVAIYTNSTLIGANSNINYNSTTTINTVITANGSGQVNVAFTMNTNSFSIIAANASANGWANLTSNAIMQWGSFPQAALIVGGSPVTVTLPLHFPNHCWQAQAQITSPGSASGMVLRILPGSLSTTQFKVSADYFTVSIANNSTIYWWAIGN